MWRQISFERYNKRFATDAGRDRLAFDDCDKTISDFKESQIYRCVMEEELTNKTLDYLVKSLFVLMFSVDLFPGWYGSRIGNGESMMLLR